MEHYVKLPLLGVLGLGDWVLSFWSADGFLRLVLGLLDRNLLIRKQSV